MVEIPDDVAKSLARELRAIEGKPVALGYIRQAADLLDPQPPTLREQVADRIHATAVDRQGCACAEGLHLAEADAALAVVADRLAAEQEKPPRSWGMEVTPDFYAGLATAEAIIRGGAS